MIYNSKNIINNDLSNFDKTNVTNRSWMFSGYETTKSIYDISKKLRGVGYKFHGDVSKPGRNQNGETKINQDTSLVHPSVGDIKGFNLFGVLDGHGPHGHYVSQFCREYFIRTFNDYAKQCMKEGITTPEGIYTKLKNSNFSFIKESFKNADLQMAKNTQFDKNFSGTTCNLVFQFKKYLLSASVGDSRGILIYDNDTKTNQYIFPLSHDHKPDLPQEFARIQSKGGRVDKLTDQYGNKVGPNRVFKAGQSYPGLAISRALGDFLAKDWELLLSQKLMNLE